MGVNRNRRSKCAGKEMYGLISLEDVSLHSKKINYLFACVYSLGSPSPYTLSKHSLHSKKINYLHVCIRWEALRRILCPNMEKIIP